MNIVFVGERGHRNRITVANYCEYLYMYNVHICTKSRIILDIRSHKVHFIKRDAVFGFHKSKRKIEIEMRFTISNKANSSMAMAIDYFNKCVPTQQKCNTSQPTNERTEPNQPGHTHVHHIIRKMSQATAVKIKKNRKKLNRSIYLVGLKVIY